MNEKKIFEKINQIINPVEGYVVFKNGENDNYFGKDDKGNTIYLTSCNQTNMESSIIETENLTFFYNKECSFMVEDKKFTERVHILICKSEDPNKILTFIKLTSLFTNESQQFVNKDYLSFFKSLVLLFDKLKNRSEIEVQGFFAELYVIKYLKENNCEVVDFWQSKQKMKFDFMITSNKRLEVKSTMKPIRIHHFLNDQLLVNDYNIIVASVMLQKSDKGLSLHKLASELKESYPNNYQLNYNIELFISKVSDELLYETKFDEKYLETHIKFYQADKIPKLENEIPLGIYNIRYDAILDNIDEMNLNEIRNWIGD